MNTLKISTYILTGKDRNDKKFRIESKNLSYLNCINVWSNRIIWAVYENGKRKKLI